MHNQPISQIEVSSFIWVRFLSKQFFTAATAKTLPMPKKSKTGKLLLEAVKREQVELQAARTAQAIVRCEGSSVESSAAQETTGPLPVLENEVLWVRHEFESGNLLVFSRGDTEAITIRKSPEGRGWYIDFGGRVDNGPN